MIREPFHDAQFAKNLLISALLLQDKLLRHCLDGVKSPSILLSYKIHLVCKASLANNLYLFIVLHGHATLWQQTCTRLTNIIISLVRRWANVLPASALRKMLHIFCFCLFGEDSNQSHPVLDYSDDLFMR